LTADQGDETTSFQAIDNGLTVMLAHQLKLLSLGWAYRDDHSPALLLLLEESRRDAGRGGGDNDAVEGSEFRKTLAAITYGHGRITVAESYERGFSFARQLGMAFDREDMSAEFGKNSSLIAGAGANLQDF
jgi:hypothetical protein